MRIYMHGNEMAATDSAVVEARARSSEASSKSVKHPVVLKVGRTTIEGAVYLTESEIRRAYAALGPAERAEANAALPTFPREAMRLVLGGDYVEDYTEKMRRLMAALDPRWEDDPQPGEDVLVDDPYFDDAVKLRKFIEFVVTVTNLNGWEELVRLQDVLLNELVPCSVVATHYSKQGTTAFRVKVETPRTANRFYRQVMMLIGSHPGDIHIAGLR